MHTNTRILAHNFVYHEPKTLDEALTLLDKHKPGIKILAGGTDVLPKMKRNHFECERLMYIKNIKELSFIDNSNGLKIGAATLLSDLEKSPEIKQNYHALHEAIKAIGAIAIRNMATIGGNICNAAPPADTVPALLIFDAQLKLVKLGGERTVPLNQFITGAEQTIIEHGELLHSIEMPELTGGLLSTFVKLGRVSVDTARINMAVAADIDGSSNTIKTARVALGAVGTKAYRCPDSEALLAGKKVDESVILAFADSLTSVCDYAIPGRYSLPYKREAVRKLAEDAFKQLLS
ncbi:MAG: xanthine dehydrogenase family protein subunit M [Bacillota bacterium]|nr:xanthine dehydrogenase family protein subunit M [Bacillota bacterium]MDW7730138.1 xanthine dehydrogenase family protein subunit M [Bacillota bacterium]